MFLNWSEAESTHCKYKHKKGYYGRFGIGKAWLTDYCRYNKFDIKEISDIKSFLENDSNNCYITAWSFAFWRRKGLSDREIIQVWLWGLYSVYEKGHWSYSYQYKIFGDIEEKKLNMEAYKKLIWR